MVNMDGIFRVLIVASAVVGWAVIELLIWLSSFITVGFS